MKRMVLCGALAAAACSSNASNGSGGGGGGGTGKPLPPAPPDANLGPPVLARVPEAWWTLDPPCPDGGKLQGKPHPESNWVACHDWEGKNHGPWTQWWGDGAGRSEGMWEHGQRHGVWIQIHASGTKLEETAWRADKQHGPSQRWWPNGQKKMEGTYVDGRADGTFRAWAEDGKEIGSFTMKLGTGTFKEFNADGTVAWDQAQVDGENHGVARAYHENGAVRSESHWVRGGQDGVNVTYTPEGTKWVEGMYRGDQRQGRWLFWGKDGEIERAEDFRDDQPLAIIFYEGGKPLADAPDQGTCATEAGLKAAAGQAKSEYACVSRAEHFPGIALVGGFAHDRGCMQTGFVVDCTPQEKVSSAAILARAGWSKATGDRRKAIAMEYLHEILLDMRGSLVRDQPKPPETTPVADLASDGTVTIHGWVRDPSGMVPEITSRETTWTFTPKGDVTGTSGRVETFDLR
jgi:antitoxin component YwqK of YwqJK toxin-antitoxin module